jgi:chemotaxis protein MotB
MNKHVGYIIFAILILSVLSSCIVSKKKYQALEMEMVLKADSLNNIIAKNREDFNFFMNNTSQNDAYKNDMLDSMAIKVNSLSSDTLLLKQSLKDAIFEYNTEKEKLVAISSELDILKTDLGNKEQELKSLQEVIDKNKAEADKLKEAITTALKSFDDTQLSVYQKNGKVYVQLEESLLFKSGSSKVDKKGEEAIIKLSEVLAKNQGIDILVEGHTDNVGTVDYNWDLSTKRALAIVKIMQDNSEIDEARITAAGRCMFVPVALNDTEEGKKKNRRSEIILTPNLEGLYKILEE